MNESCDMHFVVMIKNNDEIISDNFACIYEENEVKIIKNITLMIIDSKVPWNIALFLKTSGSTSKTKICMHSHDSILFSARSHRDALNYKENEVSLVVLPLVYSFAHTSQFIAIQLLGGTLVLYPQGQIISFKRLNNLVNKYHITSMCMQSSHINMWAEYEKGKQREQSFEGLYSVCFAGGPASFDSYYCLRKKYENINFLQAYGLTEAGPRVTVNRPNIEKNNKTCGVAVSGVDVIMLAEDKKGVEMGEVGEIGVKGPNLMIGYYSKERGIN